MYHFQFAKRKRAKTLFPLRTVPYGPTSVASLPTILPVQEFDASSVFPLFPVLHRDGRFQRSLHRLRITIDLAIFRCLFPGTLAGSAVQQIVRFLEIFSLTFTAGYRYHSAANR